MKRSFFKFLIIIISICFLYCNAVSFIRASEEEFIDEMLDDTIITDFDYFPSASLSNKSIINIVWRTRSNMDNLIIKTYSTVQGEYVKLFDMQWDLNDIENNNDVVFKIINAPLDDPETEYDETEGELWCYNISFRIDNSNIGLLNIIFEYTSNDKEYKNTFYIPNVANRQTNFSGNYEKKVTTANAIKVSIFASIAAVMGTVVIIWNTRIKRTNDEEDEGGKC